MEQAYSVGKVTMPRRNAAAADQRGQHTLQQWTDQRRHTCMHTIALTLAWT